MKKFNAILNTRDKINFSTTQAPQLSFKNRSALQESETAGCYFCCNTYPVTEITEYTDANKAGVGQTALCPKCGIDSVLPMTTLTLDELKQIKDYFNIH